MRTGGDHTISDVLTRIAAEFYGGELDAVPDRLASIMKRDIASSHGQLLAAMVAAKAQFQIAAELGRIADALAEHLGKVGPK